jgi:hypothetical protein
MLMCEELVLSTTVEIRFRSGYVSRKSSLIKSIAERSRKMSQLSTQEFCSFLLDLSDIIFT